MADGSVAPKERVNIVYKSNTGDQSEDVELPLKLLMIGDYMGKEQDVVVEERDPVNVNKENFDDVMKGMNLKMNLNVNNTLTDDAEPMPVEINVNSMNDFSPESVAKQVPELNSLLQMREITVEARGLGQDRTHGGACLCVCAQTRHRIERACRELTAGNR